MLSVVVVIVVTVVRGIGRSVILEGGDLIDQDFVFGGWMIFVGVMVGLVRVNQIFIGGVEWGSERDVGWGVG